MIEIKPNEIRRKQAGQPQLLSSLDNLVKLAARSDSGGAYVAAKVVLSAYNSSDYPLDIAELGALDTDLFEDALNVIRLRIQHAYEPHEFFTEGRQLFEAIAEEKG